MYLVNLDSLTLDLANSLLMRILFYCLLTYFALLQQSYATLTIEITGGTEGGGQPIAIVPFVLETGVSSLSEDIVKIISEDLYRTGRFAIDSKDSLSKELLDSVNIPFPLWLSKGIAHVIVGSIKNKKGGGYLIEFKLFDVAQGLKIVGLRYAADTHNLRQIAHQISDEIYKALTGERGVFSTQIVYVTLKRDEQKLPYHLSVADVDGANPRVMFKSKEPIFSPSWSPDGKKMAYVTYEGVLKHKKMVMYVQEISTGKRKIVSSEPGLNAAPSWSPDGTHLALTLSKDGNSEIYILKLDDNTLTRLTHHTAIDTEAEWHPDGTFLVFTSNRGGKPQIYRISSKGGNVERVTFKGKYNARPRFSPDGQKLALLHNNGQGYQIAILDFKSTSPQYKILTQTTLDESPCFAPNGSMILYTTEKSLSAVSVDGQVRQRLADTVGEIREPAWSPFLDEVD